LKEEDKLKFEEALKEVSNIYTQLIKSFTKKQLKQIMIIESDENHRNAIIQAQMIKIGVIKRV